MDGQQGVEFDVLFDHPEGFFVGVWRRTPFEVTCFPMCLNAGFLNDNECGLDAYDAESGNVWRFQPSPAHERTPGGDCWALLVCSDAHGKDFWLGPDLQCHDDRRECHGGPDRAYERDALLGHRLYWHSLCSWNLIAYKVCRRSLATSHTAASIC